MLLVALVVLAQATPPPTPPDLSGLPQLKAQAPEPTERRPFPTTDPERIADVGRRFFERLIAGDVRGASELCAVPFALDQRTVDSADELRRVWVDLLREKRSDLLTLYGVEILTP